jgi:peptide/nickel transport system substrate-binding protein
MKIDGVAAQDVTESGRVSVGTDNQTRGAGGELKMLQWQAATIAMSHKGQGTKDILASCLVLEPLFSYNVEAQLTPTLAAEVPTVENGGLSEDYLTATINLREGILWSDGEPFTADDVQFTWQWISNEENAATSFTTWQTVESIEVLSPTQVQVTFREPSLSWYVPLSGANYGAILPKHVLDVEDGDAATTAFLTNPIGTGPYKVETFRENDQIIYVINENYREPNKPYFATVNLKGGGDATSAAQAVLQTGDWHFAWNLQVEADLLQEMIESGGRGTVGVSPPTNRESLMFNFSDPNVELDGERAHLEVPNPRTTDLVVRQALALGVDRETIATQFYDPSGEQEPAGRNAITGLPQFESPNTTTEFNIEKGIQMLEEAGWVMDGDTRAKDGVELQFTYYTSINSVRQKTQQVVKSAWEQMGIGVQLGQVDASVFFASAAGNDQTYTHNYRDIQMYTATNDSADPSLFMQEFYAGPDNSNVAQASNEWTGTNVHRWVNAEYDAMYDEARATIDPERAAELYIAMNDLVISEVVLIPQVSRAAHKYAISNELVPDNIAATFAEPLYYNIANWTAVEQ